MNRLIVQRGFAAVQMFNKLRDAAAVIELFGTDIFAALIGKRNLQTAIEERKLAQPAGQSIEIELGGVHDRRISLERDFRAGLGGFTRFSKGSFGDAAFIILFPGGFVAPDLEVQRLGQSVHAAYTDAMESAGDFVRVRIELAAGM